MTPSPHEAASHHLPPFITAPGGSDWLLILMGIVLLGSVLGAGVFFFWLHSLPERMVHNKVQFDIVARSRAARRSLRTSTRSGSRPLSLRSSTFRISRYPMSRVRCGEWQVRSKRWLTPKHNPARREISAAGRPATSAGPKPLPSAQAKADDPSSATHAHRTGAEAGGRTCLS